MNQQKREVWITGIGLVSSFGEGAEHHWKTMGAEKAPDVIQDKDSYPPYVVHPLPEMEWAKQIPRRGDQRQMENWQRLGTYAAGLALDDAGAKDDEELVSTMDLVVGAGGGERDIETDNSILEEAATHNDRERLLNNRLSNELRPTLFLAQLSNLLAGNISIVHKVTGSSRTYMGEENAGVTVIENAVSRIAAGQSTHALVGGAFNAERQDLLLIMELGNFLLQGSGDPVLKRQAQGGGLVTGSAGAFLVIEDAEFAKKRGATPYAKITGIASDLGPREEGQIKARAKDMLGKICDDKGSIDAVISGASGVPGVTGEETQFLAENLPDAPVRHFASSTGHCMEAVFPFAVGLAALSLKNGKNYPQFEEAEAPATGAPSKLLVTSFSHWRGEGMGLVEKV